MKERTKKLIPWVGGKAQLMWAIQMLLPTRYQTLVDVFGGSGIITLGMLFSMLCQERCSVGNQGSSDGISTESFVAQYFKSSQLLRTNLHFHVENLPFLNSSNCSSKNSSSIVGVTMDNPFT